MYLHLKFELPQFIECGYLKKVKEQCNETNINKPLYLGRTPLHIAVITAHPEIISYLLKLGPDM